MKFTTSTVAGFVFFTSAVQGQGNEMVKMCLFYPNESGHARSDPIVDQNCASAHVHTFYGPQNFHPNTSYEDLRDTPARFSSTPFVENQSLYWHPSIYRVTNDGSGTETFTRVNNLSSSPYYRWDKSNAPEVVAFPPGFRMIAHSNDVGASQGGESGGNMLTECCDYDSNGEEQCETWDRLHFPTRTCGFLGIAMAMPTCWNDSSLGDDNDHKSHMAYTTNGEVNGPCPSGFNKRVPQVQLFVRINDYQGGTYQLSDGTSVWHVDFFNGWKEGKLQELIDTCEPDRSVDHGDFNPPCSCAEENLTKNTEAAGAVCDSDVRRLILDEATDVTIQLPMGACEGPSLITKSWTQLDDTIIQCTMPPGTAIGSSEDEDSDAASDEGEDEDEVSEEEDGHEASEEEIEDEEGHDEDHDEEDPDDEDHNEEDPEDEEYSEVSEEEEDGQSASEEEEEEGEDGYEEGEIEDEDSEEAHSEEDPDEEDGYEDSNQAEDLDDEEDNNESLDEEHPDDEMEEEVSEDEDDNTEAAGRARVSTVGAAPSQSCHLTCWDDSDTCQSAIVTTCENYFNGCQSECYDAEAAGDIAEDELSTCVDEWCMNDKQLCYNEAQTRCQNRRRDCLLHC